jgi:hypothetical protein
MVIQFRKAAIITSELKEVALAKGQVVVASDSSEDEELARRKRKEEKKRLKREEEERQRRKEEKRLRKQQEQEEEERRQRKALKKKRKQAEREEQEEEEEEEEEEGEEEREDVIIKKKTKSGSKKESVGEEALVESGVEGVQGGQYFKRINEDAYFERAVVKDNSHWAAKKGGDSWGTKAATDLIAVKGRNFRKEMQKKKRASWVGGGALEAGVNSIVYSDYSD